MRFDVVYNNVKMDVILNFEEEDTAIADTIDVDDLNEIYRKLDNGELVYFCAVMKCYVDGIELGYDCLGCCIYESYDSFVNEDDYFGDMKENVCCEAYKNMMKLCSHINT